MNALLHPITSKELSGFSRRWQTYTGRVIYVALIGVLIYWFSAETFSKAATLSLSSYAALSRDIFKAFCVLQIAFVTLGAVATASDSISREARAGTLGLLLLAPFTPRGIAGSKWRAAMAQAASLLLCGMPVLAVCVYLGGTGWEDLLWSTSLTFATAGLGAAIALKYSARSSTPTRAALWAYLWLGLSPLFPLLLLFVLGPIAPYLWPFLHPAFAAVTMVKDRFDTPALGYGWISATAVSFAAVHFILRSAARDIERRATTPPLPSASRGDFASLESWYTRLPGLGSFRHSVWEDRPLLWKELATRSAGRLERDTKQVGLIYFGAVLAACWLITWGRSPAMFAFIGVCLLAPAVATGAALFATEREGRRMEMLLVAPVTEREIVHAKLLSGLIAPESLALLSLWGVAVLAWSWSSWPAGLVVYAAVSGLTLAFAFVLSAVASLRAASPREAVRSASVWLVVLLLALPLVASVLESSSRDSAVTVLVAGAVRTIHPLYHLEALGTDLDRIGRATPPPLFLVFVLLYGGATVGLIAGMPRLLRRVTGRA